MRLVAMLIQQQIIRNKLQIKETPRYRRLLKCGLSGKDEKESIDITGNGRKQIVVINNVN